MSAHVLYNNWLSSSWIDSDDREELNTILGSCKEIEERFSRTLSFGTGGIRATMGLGTNQLNKYTIRMIAKGFSEYLRNAFSDDVLKVVISFDSRNNSLLYAKECTKVLVANGIVVYLFDDIRPTPELSYAVRKLSCHAGIAITASHNPAEYNGFKVYGSDGGQVTDLVANKITEAIKIGELDTEIKMADLDMALAAGSLKYLDETMDEDYVNEIKTLSLNSDLTKDLKILYSPLHGSGYKLIPKSLNASGFSNLYIVDEQYAPDGNFSTVKVPNPEDSAAYNMAYHYAERCKPDIILLTDPDCDRIGVAVKATDGYLQLSGNQIGALLVDYILSNSVVSKNDVIIKTIVTSEFGAKVAALYGAETVNTLTGFKYIGEQIGYFEDEKSKRFVFGYEESCGYLTGTFVRDKDAVIASCLICEMANYHLQNNSSMLQRLSELENKIGFYADSLDSFVFEGGDGKKALDTIMLQLRRGEILNRLFGRVQKIADYKVGRLLDYSTQEEQPVNLPKSDVVKIWIDDDSWIAIRPSGTEPKLKIYYSIVGKSRIQADMQAQIYKDRISMLIADLKCAIN